MSLTDISEEMAKLRSSGVFDADWYAAHYRDVPKGIDPLEHYIRVGKKLARAVAPPSFSSYGTGLYGKIIGEKFNQISEAEFASKIAAFFERPQSSNKIAVYTAIFGKYDYLRAPYSVEDGIDYICFTNQRHIRAHGYNVVHVPDLFEDQTLNARMLKALPHLFLKEFETTVWIDGSTRIRGRSLKSLITQQLGDADLGVHRHFQRDCVYMEAAECIAQKKESVERIESLTNLLKGFNWPSSSGLFETAQLIRKNNPAISSANELWWSLIRDYSRRDQISLPYVIKQSKLRVFDLPGCQWLDPYFKNLFHTPNHHAITSGPETVRMVMLVHNALEMTRKSIESIIRHTKFANYKLVVVDNASSAETASFLRNISQENDNILLIRNEENKSFSQANNEAVNSANEEYLLFINNDIEIIDPLWLDKLVSEARRHKDAAAFGPIMLYPDYEIQSAGIEITFDDKGLVVPSKEVRTYRHPRYVDGISGGCALVRRSAHERIGGFDERFFYGQEDIDYCIRLREAGYKIRLCSQIEVLHHESYTRKFSVRTIRNREIIKTKWGNRVSSGIVPAPAVKPKYEELLKRPLNYRSIDDLIGVVRKNSHMIPQNIDMVVGIPRSGMIPAYIIGLNLNSPVLSIDEFNNGMLPTKGDRPQNNVAALNGVINVLVVDDSINYGNSHARIKATLAKSYRGMAVRPQFMAVYGSEFWTSNEVMTLEQCNLPRMFQWNYKNHGISQFACFDLDGVLCIDPTEEENDDGKMYLEFLRTARPLYIPKYPIRAIVTSRLEKYRQETVDWLRLNNVKYKELYMLDLPSKEERLRLKAHGSFKANIYMQLSDAVLFYESNPAQAREVAKLTGKAVICTDTDEYFPAETS